MPFDLDPEGTLNLSLPTDAHLPEPERPTFVLRFLTRRQYRRYCAVREKMSRATTDEAIIGHAAAALSMGLADWFNVRDRAGAAVPFDPSRLPHVVTTQEMLWLMAAYPASFRLDGEEERGLTLAMYRRYGKFCKNCGAAGQCVSKPSVANCIQLGLVCRVCKGDLEKRKTCPACGGWGRDVIIDCPLNHIQPFVWELLQAADFAKKGFWPASPAMLENTESCIAAVRHVWWLEDHVKAEMAEER